MKHIQEVFEAQTQEKGSKFIAFLMPYYVFDSKMVELKNQHPKAVHYVYAYRHLNEFSQIVENCSDDGEPKGTSGRPSLKVLAGNDLINTAVIIVRYFGGTKLGTGGLVRAYSDSVNEVIKIAKLENFEFLEEKIITIEYSEFSKLEYKILQSNLQIISKDFGEKIDLKIQGTKENFIKLLEMI